MGRSLGDGTASDNRRKVLTDTAHDAGAGTLSRILFITATRLGDAVLSTGLLHHLLDTMPLARITVACGPVAAELFQRMPRLERVIVVEKQRYDLHWLQLWRDCVRTRWDLAIDLRGSAVTLLLPARKRRIMRGGRRPGHRTQHLAGVLGLDPAPMPVSWFDGEDAAVAAAMLPDAADPTAPFVGLGPTANWSGKVWPAARFAALFAGLRERIPGARPVVFAGPGETEHAMAQALIDRLPVQPVDLRGNLSLPEVSAALARCCLFVGNDSGLMHLAAATGIPTLGLFGPSRASEYAPAGPRTAFVQAPGPEGDAPIGGLSVEAALGAALSLLAAHPVERAA